MSTRREYDGDPRSLGRECNQLPWTILRVLVFLYVVITTGWIILTEAFR